MAGNEEAHVGEETGPVGMPEVTEEVGKGPERETPAPKQAPPATPQGNYVSARVMYLTVIIVSMAMSILSVTVYDRAFATKVAVYDLPGLVMKLQSAVASKQLTQEQAGAIIDQATARINALPSNYVTISGDVILGKAPKAKKLFIDPR